MAPDPGSTDDDRRPPDGAAGSATDRARIDYLTGDRDVRLTAADQAELDELRDLLADPTLWAEPPAEQEDAVVAAIAAESGARARDQIGDQIGDRPQGAPPADQLAAARRRRASRSGWRRPAVWVGVAAAIVAVVAGGVLVLRPAGERTFDVALAATDLAPTASGQAVMVRKDSGWEITLTATGLPRLDNGRFYQGWLRNADGVLVPIGTFNDGTDVVLWSGVSPEAFPTMTVTQEQADGDQASSGQRVLVGTAVEVK
ncbi:MAG: anti-sigma factor [Nakamurella multipartita]